MISTKNLWDYFDNVYASSNLQLFAAELGCDYARLKSENKLIGSGIVEAGYGFMHVAETRAGTHCSPDEE